MNAASATLYLQQTQRFSAAFLYSAEAQVKKSGNIFRKMFHMFSFSGSAGCLPAYSRERHRSGTNGTLFA